MQPPIPINQIDEQATRWAALLAHGSPGPRELAALEAWLQADRRHQGALARANAALHLLEEAALAEAAPADQPETAPHPRPSHRTPRFMALAAGLATMVIGAAILLSLFHEPATEQQLELDDGSLVTLLDNGRIQADVTDEVRAITLISGTASFNVAKDTTRPFVVSAGEVSAQATGTVYAVSRVGETGAHVHVDEGSVLVWAKSAPEQSVLLEAGARLTLEPGQSTGSPLPPPEMAHISLENDTIESAVARFNRINQVQVIVTDPEIGEVRVVGLFKASDPLAFARAAAAIANVSATDLGSAIIIGNPPAAVTKN